jgi:hypothetical protein
VPTEKVIEVYEGVILARFALLMNSTHPDIVSNLASIKKWVAYYEYTWVGQRQEDGSRGRGLFPLVQWSQNEAALQLWPRTNNSSEGSNSFLILNTLLGLGLTTCIQSYNYSPPPSHTPKRISSVASHKNLFCPWESADIALSTCWVFVIVIVLYYLGFNSTWNEGLPKNASLHTVQKYFVDKV